MFRPASAESDDRSGRLQDTATLIERLIILALVTGLVAGVVLVLRPFVTAILFAAIVVIATWPIRGWLHQRGVPVGVSAALFLALLLGLVGIPAILFAPDLGERLIQGGHRLHAYISRHPQMPTWLDQFPLVRERAARLWAQVFNADGGLEANLRLYAPEIRKLLIDLGRTFAEGLLQLLLALILATMFWIRGETLVATMADIAERLGGSVANSALVSAANAVRGVAYGVVGTAIIQAIAMTAGLLVAGVPGAGLLGFLSLLIAISQIGVLLILIWGGAAWWLFNAGYGAWGVAMIVWGLFVSTVDNVVRPWLVSFGTPLPVTLIFLGVLGGFIAFGFLGLFIGPTLLGVALMLLQTWRRRLPEAVDRP